MKCSWRVERSFVIFFTVSPTEYVRISALLKILLLKDDRLAVTNSSEECYASIRALLRIRILKDASLAPNSSSVGCYASIWALLRIRILKDSSLAPTNSPVGCYARLCYMKLSYALLHSTKLGYWYHNWEDERLNESPGPKRKGGPTFPAAAVKQRRGGQWREEGGKKGNRGKKKRKRRTKREKHKQFVARDQVWTESHSWTHKQKISQIKFCLSRRELRKAALFSAGPPQVCLMGLKYTFSRNWIFTPCGELCKSSNWSQNMESMKWLFHMTPVIWMEKQREGE